MRMRSVPYHVHFVAGSKPRSFASMRFKLLVVLSVVTVAAAFPGRLLRVPKIYNALITTKEKLLPSEAFPATTGPIFQPIAFTGEPILLNANDFINNANQQEAWRKATQNNRDGNDKSTDPADPKGPSPIVFYPRYGVYYPHHTVVSYVNTLQHSFVYTAVDHSKGAVKKPLTRTEVDRSPNVEDYVQESIYPQTEIAYAKNNRSGKVLDVPPPPPPVGYSNNEQDKEAEVR